MTQNRYKKDTVGDTPGHKKTRSTLRVVGPLILGCGGILTLIGLGSFFMSFGSFDPPRFFWCAFLGLPMLVFGAAITKAGYLGNIARYVANEAAPVGKDVVNYMAENTQDAVQTVASSLASGIKEGLSDTPVSTCNCPDCGAENNADAAFCDQCGNKLQTERSCPSCSSSNDPGAAFCDQCGTRLA